MHVWCIHDACIKDACMHHVCLHDASMNDACSHDACAHDAWCMCVWCKQVWCIYVWCTCLWSRSLILMHVCIYDVCIYNAAEILLRTNERTNKAILGVGWFENSNIHPYSVDVDEIFLASPWRRCISKDVHIFNHTSCATLILNCYIPNDIVTF